MATEDNLFGTNFLSFIGKLDWYEYAKDCMITIVFPQGLKEGNSVLAYWQWDVDAKGNHSLVSLKGKLDVLGKEVNSPYLRFFKGDTYYWFDGNIEIVKEDATINLVMHNPTDSGLSHFQVKLHHTE